MAFCNVRVLYFLFLSNNIGAVRSPEMSKPVSSRIPKLTAALKPNTDQITGIIRIAAGIFLSVKSNKPKVKIVVGHGRPKVGDEG